MPMPKPKTEGRYLKAPKAGQSITFRILGDPLEYYMGFKTDSEGKPHPVRKYTEGEFKRGDIDAKNKFGRAQLPTYTLAWEVMVGGERVMIFEARQTTILNSLYGLEQDEDWGDLRDYDVKITADDDGKGYSVKPKPKSPLTDAQRGLYAGLVANGFSLKVLMDGKDPFSEAGVMVSEPSNDDDIPF